MSDLNEVALGWAEQVRGAWEAEVVDLDVAVALSEHDFRTLRDEVRKASDRSNELCREWKVRQNALVDLDVVIRELKRPREGFPYFDQSQYEARMLELRLQVQQEVEELAKRGSWRE